MLRLINFFPAFLGAGIRVRRLDVEAGVVEVEMGLHLWNRNYLGTQFGGSLYSMCDPFYVLILAERLGPGYVVWDKAATIRFRRPGRGRVHARFEVSAEQIEAIRHQADTEPKVEPVLTAQVLDEAGEVVAEVEKVLYVRKKA
ncbi:MAG TPA: DUF4442 domain-containing protein [Thermoanaerobaculia bacterium]|nr:DUF4442 domain-containing protein [Thermoanaerobaculia bacterium]